jgi:hypothetical protein
VSNVHFKQDSFPLLQDSKQVFSGFLEMKQEDE